MTEKKHKYNIPNYYKLRNVFNSMKRRCKRVGGHKDYGGRGIECKWKTFRRFLQDMGEGYKEGLQIDRIDNNGNYCKENCRWVTPKENARNTRKTLKYKNEPLITICERNGLNYNTIRNRIYGLGWSIERAINTPPKISYERMGLLPKPLQTIYVKIWLILTN